MKQRTSVSLEEGEIGTPLLQTLKHSFLNGHTFLQVYGLYAQFFGGGYVLRAIVYEQSMLGFEAAFLQYPFKYLSVWFAHAYAVREVDTIEEYTYVRYTPVAHQYFIKAFFVYLVGITE